MPPPAVTTPANNYVITVEEVPAQGSGSQQQATPAGFIQISLIVPLQVTAS